MHEHLRAEGVSTEHGDTSTFKSSEPLYAGNNVKFGIKIVDQSGNGGALQVANEDDAARAAQGMDVDLLAYCRHGASSRHAGEPQNVVARRRVLVVACEADSQTSVSATLGGIQSDFDPSVSWPSAGEDRRIELRSPEVRAVVASQVVISDPPEAVRIPFVPGIPQRLPVQADGGSGTTEVAVWRAPSVPRAAGWSDRACSSPAGEVDWLGMFNETRRLYHPDSLRLSSIDDAEDGADADSLASAVRQARLVLRPGEGFVMSHQQAGTAYVVASDSLDPFNADGQAVTAAPPVQPRIAAGDVVEVMQGQAVWVGTRLFTEEDQGFYACDASAVLLDWRINGDSSLASIEAPRQDAVLDQLVAFAGPIPVQGRRERLIHGAVCDWAALVGRKSGRVTLEVSFDIGRAGRPGAPPRHTSVRVFVYPPMQVLFAPAWAQLASSSSAVQAALESSRGESSGSLGFIAQDPDADENFGKVHPSLVGSVGLDHARTYAPGRFNDVDGVPYGGDSGRLRLLGCSITDLAQSQEAQAQSSSPRALNGTALFVDAAACHSAQGAIALPRAAKSGSTADFAPGSVTLVIRDGPGSLSATSLESTDEADG